MTPGPDFDPLLLSQARLGVISVLMTRPGATFPELKSLLGLTQGNLGIHLRKLESGGYVKVTKAFVDRKPQTSAKLTAKGRKAFLHHLDQLKGIADEG